MNQSISAKHHKNKSKNWYDIEIANVVRQLDVNPSIPFSQKPKSYS